ncbi:hypothetical protein [Streptomyces sp. NPDC055107]
MRRCARVLAGVAPAVMLLTSCHLTPPTIMYAGFRMDGSELVVAMPVCRDETITGAAVYVRTEDEKKISFETLWSAREPRTAEARTGVFRVNSPRDFATVTEQLSGALPDEFYVETRQERKGEAGSASGYVDLAELKSADLADGEFVTYEGKIMTRAEINAQHPCNQRKKTTAP